MDLLRHVTKVPGIRNLWKKMPIGSVETRVRYDIWQKAPYAFGVYWAAMLARDLGVRRITAIEFGVAGGDGLVQLEEHSHLIGRSLGVDIDVYGFDSGCGMPKPIDHRDLAHVWNEGFYSVDPAQVRQRLKRSQLIIGEVGTTTIEFLESGIAPIGFVSFDLDYYSSTIKAFSIFNGPISTRLPRVFCYFDDLIWPQRACYSEFAGEYLAINEFNLAKKSKKIAKWPHLGWMRDHPAAWNEEMYVFHDFEHRDYNVNLTLSHGR
jgi:hypothetical protein